MARTRNNDVYVGIDLGTSSVKVCAVAATGEVLIQTSRSYTLESPQVGWLQIDPWVWWRETAACVRELLEFVPAVSVRAVGVTGQMHTVVPLGAEDPVYPALMWNDVRTAEMVVPARDALLVAGATDAAAIVSTGSPALNLCWLRDHEPASFEAMERFVIGPDWIVLRLTGSLGTDYCEASTSSLYSFAENSWSAAACEALGLPERILPPIRGAAEVAGSVTHQAAQDTGLLEGTPVVVGTGDNPASAIATGCLTEGATVISLGTSGVLMGRAPSGGNAAASKGKRIAFSLDRDSFTTLVQGSVQSCGHTRDWLLGDVLRASYAEAEQAQQAEDSGTGWLLFFPHLMGEKTLYGDASLRGAFVGLTPDTTRSDLDRALMEGIGYGFRQLFHEMGFVDDGTPIRVVGGGSRSDAWMQLLADVLRRPMQRVVGETGAGYGAALLARIAEPPVGSDSQEMTVKLGVRFDPNPAAVERHEHKYRKYLRMHDALKSVYDA